MCSCKREKENKRSSLIDSRDDFTLSSYYLEKSHFPFSVMNNFCLYFFTQFENNKKRRNCVFLNLLINKGRKGPKRKTKLPSDISTNRKFFLWKSISDSAMTKKRERQREKDLFPNFSLCHLFPQFQTG